MKKFADALFDVENLSGVEYERTLIGLMHSGTASPEEIAELKAMYPELPTPAESESIAAHIHLVETDDSFLDELVEQLTKSFGGPGYLICISAEDQVTEFTFGVVYYGPIQVSKEKIRLVWNIIYGASDAYMYIPPRKQ